MPRITVEAIKGSAIINGIEFPMYSGFLSPEQMREIAGVPNFNRSKAHHQIATDISNPPVDQWQRPLDDAKSNKIKDTYSDTSKNNLMANPVLIGIAAPNIDASVNVAIAPKSIPTPSGPILLDDYFTVTINYSQDKKPLWILDGQHRIEGMKRSAQRNNPIPFVLLYHESVYTPPFLAEIFTHVTTGATPMEFLHAEWMKYAFKLDEYSQDAYKKSMDTCISLCKEVTLGGGTNPFHNKIQFNPYLAPTGFFAFTFNCFEWVKIVAENFYGRGGTLNPSDLANEVVTSIRVMERLDSHRGATSKLFSNDSPHKILAEGFLCGLLKHIKSNGRKSETEWESFYLDSSRSFNRCNWSLPFVRTTGALSSGNGKPSKLIAKECFDVAFNDSSVLNGTLLSDYFQGVDAVIHITAYQKTAAGRISSRNPYEKKIMPGGLKPFDLNHGGITREIIRIESGTPNCYIVNVTDPTVVPPRPLRDSLKRGGLDVSGFPDHQEIEILSMSYSGDTKGVTKVRLDK